MDTIMVVVTLSIIPVAVLFIIAGLLSFDRGERK